MKSGFILLVTFISIFSHAENNEKKSNYSFKSKTVYLIDANTGAPIKDEKIIVYHNYEYACLTDLIRPTKCISGSQTPTDVINSKVEVKAESIERAHLTASKAKIEFQVSGTCQGQEWHPGVCTISIPLKDFNSAPDPLTIKIPFKNRAAN